MKTWQTLFTAACILGGISAASATLAQAQAVEDDGDCDDVIAPDSEDGVFYGANSQLNCNAALANQHTLIYQSDVIRNIVGRRLITPPFIQDITPAGLAYDSQAAAQNVLTGDGSFQIVPTADTAAAAAPVRKWNAWADAKLSWIDPGDIVAPTDGNLANLSAGVDYKFTDRFVFGILASYETTDLDTPAFLASTETDGFGGGAYVGVTLTDNIVFSGMLTGTTIDTDSEFLGAASDIDSDRIQASAGVTGYWYFGKTRLSPSTTVAWSKEWQDEFTDSLGAFSPDQTIETAVLSLGNQLGHTFTLANGQTIEPWAGALFDWTFVNQVHTDGFSTTDLNDAYDLRLQSGLIWTIATNAQLSLTGEISGLLMPDNDIYSGQANLAIQF